MKNIKRIITSALLLGLMACEGDLEPQVFDRLSPDNFPVNAEDAKVAVTGAYHILNTGTYGGFGDVSWQGRLIMSTATTDEFVCFWGGSVWETYRRFLWNSSSPHVTNKTYGPYIKAITNCVNTIEMIDPIEIDAELKSRYQAELKGIMALLGFTLYDFYGPVPIVVDPEITLNPNTDFQPERPSREWMVGFIKDNARWAADHLPLQYPANDYGRITKGTALMILLKLAMHEKDWQEAVNISQEIMGLDYYGLQSSYLSVFAVDNEMNNEVIFVIPEAVTAPGLGNNWLAHVLPSPYVEPNGIPVQKWGGYKVPWEMYDKYEEGDLRLEAIWGELNTSSGVVDLRTINEPWAQMGAVPYKYQADPASTGQVHGNDYVVYRYADVLLLRAEALNELSGPNQESIDLINVVRERANASLIALDQFEDKDALNDFILDERFRELFQEGHRRQDLIRHGKYLSEAVKRNAAYTDETRLLFPIPQWAINENDKITQNPGY